MLRIIVACLIVNINSSLALSNTDQHENKVHPQSNHTHGKGALKYDLDSTKYSLSGKEQKVFIQLLTEKPLSKTFKKDLDTEKLSLGLPEIHKPPVEKTTKEWAAFRRWKENAEGKPPVKNRQSRTFTAGKSVMGKLALQSLTTMNSAIISPYQIVKDTLVNNILPGESITKQQEKIKLQSGKSSLGKISTQKPTVEWAALRRLKENVDENPITVKSLTDETAFGYWQGNISETISTTRKHELINVVDKQPTTENIKIESHSISGMKKTVVENLYKKSTTKKLAIEKSATKKPGFYNLRNNLIKKKLNKTLTRYRVRNKKVLQNTSQRTLQTIKSTTEKSRKYIKRIPSWKIIEKLLKERKARHKPVSKKAASIKRAAPQKPPLLCWDGRAVQQVPTRPEPGSKVKIKRTEQNGKIVYRKVNNKTIPAWSMRVKPSRETTYKKFVNRKSHTKKGTRSPTKTVRKYGAKKPKRKKGKIIMSRNRKVSKKNTKRKKS